MTAYTFDQIIDYTRTSAATYVANTGFVTQTPASRNLLTYTQEFDNAAWTKSNANAYPFDPAAATLGPELVTNGDFSAGSTGWTDITGSWAVTGGALAGTSIPASAYGPYSNGVATAGRIYLATFTITVASGSLLVRVGNTESSAYTTGGTFSQYFTATSSAATIFQLRAGGAGFTGTIDNISVREVIGGLITAPDGTLTGDALIENSSTAIHHTFQNYTASSGQAYTLSVYAKLATGSRYLTIATGDGSCAIATFNLQTGTISGAAAVIGANWSTPSAQIIAAGNGWYRCSVSGMSVVPGSRSAFFTLNSTSSNPAAGSGASYAGDGTSGIHLWGAQLEAVPDANLVLGSELRGGGVVSTVGSPSPLATYNTTTGEATLNRVDGSNVSGVRIPVGGAGRAIRVSVTITATTSTVQVRGNGIAGTILGTVGSTAGTYLLYVVSDTADIYLTSGSNATTASITVNSIREITGTTGMPTTYTRNVGGVYPPRFDYDPVTLAPRGLLIEEQRTNLVLRSEEFDNAVWARNGNGAAAVPVVTANAGISPDGTMNADRVQFDCTDNTNTNNRSSLVQSVTVVNAAPYRGSLYVKAFDAGNVGKTIRITSDGLGTVVATLTANWTRVEFGGTSTFTVTNYIIECRGTYTTQTADVLIWGAQLEAGAFATSYIPTVASQVTRTADLATVTGANFSRWYNQSAGSFVVEFQTVQSATAIARNIVGFDSSNSKLVVYIASTGTQAGTWDGSAAVTASGSVVSGTPKVAMAYSASDRAITTNGGTVATGAAPAAGFTASTILNIGGTTGSGLVNGHLRRIRYYPTRLSNTQLQALTA